MVMIRSLKRDENDRGLEVATSHGPLLETRDYSLWRAPLQPLPFHRDCHHAGGAHEIHSSHEASVP
jgi:hypothetical protein